MRLSFSVHVTTTKSHTYTRVRAQAGLRTLELEGQSHLDRPTCTLLHRRFPALRRLYIETPRGDEVYDAIFRCDFGLVCVPCFLL